MLTSLPNWPQRRFAPRLVPSAAFGTQLLPCARPHERREHISRTRFIHHNELRPMIIHVLPSPSMSCQFEVNVFYLNTGGFNFPCLQLPLPLCSAGLRCHAALERAAGSLCPDKPPRLLRHVILDNYQVLETRTKNPTAGDTVTSGCAFSYVLYLTSFLYLLLRLPARNQSLPVIRVLYVHKEVQYSTCHC